LNACVVPRLAVIPWDHGCNLLVPATDAHRVIEDVCERAPHALGDVIVGRDDNHTWIPDHLERRLAHGV